MIENQEKVNTISQHIKKTRTQLDINGQKSTKKDKKLTKNHIHAPQSYFGPKFQKNLIFRFSIIFVK